MVRKYFYLKKGIKFLCLTKEGNMEFRGCNCKPYLFKSKEDAITYIELSFGDDKEIFVKEVSVNFYG